MLGLRFCARAFSSCGERGPLFIVVRGPLTIAASPVAEHRLQTRRLSNCGSRAQLLRSMWYLPRPGLEPVSPALAGGFLTTAPPGKPTTVLSCLHWCLPIQGNPWLDHYGQTLVYLIGVGDRDEFETWAKAGCKETFIKANDFGTTCQQLGKPRQLIFNRRMALCNFCFNSLTLASVYKGY